MTISNEQITITAILGLWREGRSGGHIAGQFAMSRSAVMGIIDRAKKRGEPGLVRVDRYSNHVKPEKSRKTRRLKANRPLYPVHIPFMVQLEALEGGQCRWPIGDPKMPDFGFCGRPQADNSSYCAHHHAIAVVNAPAYIWSKKRVLMLPWPRP